MSALGHKQAFALQWAMSALPPKADMCSATRNVRFGPIADVARYSIISSARACSAGGTLRPSALAVLRLITNSYLVGTCTGRLLAVRLRAGRRAHRLSQLSRHLTHARRHRCHSQFRWCQVGSPPRQAMAQRFGLPRARW